MAVSEKADVVAKRQKLKSSSLYPGWLKRSSQDGFTYKDYLTWDDGIRVELLNGLVYMMAGASVLHQDRVLDIGSQLKNFLKDKTCKVFVAPFDVRLFPKENDLDKTVVQPDILVVCDKEKLIDGKACKGAPDFIIEIMSETTEAHDRITKKKLYEEAGVKEYWIVAETMLTKYVLLHNKYHGVDIDISQGQKVPVEILPECVIRINEN